MLRRLSLSMRSEAEDLKTIVVHVSSWDWEMSAAGFFVVNRSVMGGVSFLNFSNCVVKGKDMDKLTEILIVLNR